MNRVLIILLFLLGISNSIIFAQSGKTPESFDVTSLGQAIFIYKTMNQGRLPTNWNELGQIYNLKALDNNLLGRESYPLEDHYQFITQPMFLTDMGWSDLNGSQILLIRTVPLESKDAVGTGIQRQRRYVIYQRQNGEIGAISIPEQIVQTMLQKAGITITPKAGLPAVEDDEKIIPVPPRHLIPNPSLPQLQALNAANQQAPATPSPSEVKSQPVPLASVPAEPADESRIPLWIYGVIILSLGCIGGIWFFFLREKK